MNNGPSVIIVSWNVKAKLKRCLESLLTEPIQQIIVVDNNSADGSVAMVHQEYPQVKLLALTENIGFAAANNLAARDTVGDLVFLNPDTYLEPEFFQTLDKFWYSHSQAGVVGGRIVYDDGKVQRSIRRFPTFWSSLLDTIRLLGRFPQLAKKYLQPKFDYTKAQAVDQIMGACFAVKRKVWDELGGFDENFFVWFEEVDFCKRIKRAGFEVWYNPELHLSHTQGASFYQLSYFKRYCLFMHSLLYYLKKHHAAWERILIWCISRPVYIIVFLLDYVIPRRT
ncbi:MAG: glycosyltransferase family 2 protein [Patescibacteria group bacterium]